MIPVDFEIARTLREYNHQRFVYTRYADDFQISSKYSFSFTEIQDVIVSILKNFEAPFTINSAKTRYGSSAGQNWNLGLMLNKDNEIVDEWTSTNQEHFVKNLVVGDEYTLVEETSPNGYKKAEPIKFTVEDDGKVIQKVAMYDECIPNVNTGVSDHRTLFEALGVLSVGAILIMTSFKKKHGKSK